MRRIFLFLWSGVAFIANGQEMVPAANKFIKQLNEAQRSKTVFPFDTDDRFNFYYFPVNDRKGLPLEEMTALQKSAAFELIKTSLSKTTVKKVQEIIELEDILKELEHRKEGDDFRDPGKYYLAIFGVPADSTVWGWRFEGHHVSFHFSAKNNKLVSGTPGFLGSNPAVVPSGPKKGHEILNEEKQMAFSLLHLFNSEQLKKVVIDSVAPGDIITGTSRKASIDKRIGLRYTEMSGKQQEGLLKLIHLYIYRYKKDLADKMLAEMKQAGFENLTFAWAGDREPGVGHPHYYRIHGPTLIIEYDNTQNNANHVHTVVRDLLHDYGGDELLEHYRSGHHHK